MQQYESMNYYELLGVAQSASPEEIRLAYQEMARVYHPDSSFYDEIVVSRASDESRRLFQMITTAYSTLVDEEKRRFYDRTLKQEHERRLSGVHPTRRTLTFQRELFLAHANHEEIPSYEEIEGTNGKTASMADLIKERKGNWHSNALYLFLFIAVVSVVINLIAGALST